MWMLTKNGLPVCASRDMDGCLELATMTSRGENHSLRKPNLLKVVYDSGAYATRMVTVDFKTLYVLFNKDGKQILIDTLDGIDCFIEGEYETYPGGCARKRMVYEYDVIADWVETPGED